MFYKIWFICIVVFFGYNLNSIGREKMDVFNDII